MFVIASRPGEHGDAPSALERMFADDATLAPLRRDIGLHPLGEVSARGLIGRLLESSAVPAQLEARLIRQTAGNPFYLEELVRMMVATREIERDPATDEWRLAGKPGTDALPGSVEDVILARIDRLDAGAKQLLKIAAVVGRRFSPAILAAVAREQADFEGDIAALKTAELLQDGRGHPEPELMFRHPLTHQAVYGSLLEEQRRHLHETVGLAIEETYADRREENCAVLAHHFAHARDWERAREYLFTAGTQAGRIAADAEALALYEDALRAEKASARTPDLIRRLETEASMAEALYRLGRNDAALEHALGALAELGFSYPGNAKETRSAIATKLADRTLRRLLRPLRGLRSGGSAPADPAYLLASRLFEVIGAIDYFLDPQRFVLGILTMREEAEKRPLSRSLVVSTSSLGLICDTLGRYRLGAGLHGRATRMAERLNDPLALGYCNHLLGLHQYSRGQWPAALVTLASGAAQLKVAGHLRFWASCIGANYFVLRSMGDPRWIELARRQLEVAEEINDHHAIAWGVNAAGVAALYRGDHDVARPLFEKASIAYEAIPDYRFLSGACARRALCHALAGEVDPALKLLERSEMLVSRYRIGGMSASAAVLVGAEAYLRVAEHLNGGARAAQVLRLADSACARATRHGRGVGDESAAEALRLNGMLAWLGGEKAHALKSWQAAIAAARVIGADYVLARTHHAVAVRTGDQAHAGKARELFSKAGAAPFRTA
jgi:tetratricopeptide (TPR) repeat protein